MDRLPLAAALVALLAAGCRTAPEVRPPSTPAALSSQELALTDQGITDFRLKLDGEVESPEAPARLTRAVWELVVEGQVVDHGDEPLGVEVPANGRAHFALEKVGRLVRSPADLAAMLETRSTALTALRGELVLVRGGREERVPFARSRELRVPRPPEVHLESVDGARYGPDRVVLTLELGVRNPNAFPVRLGRLTWKGEVAGKALEEGEVARSAEVGPSRSRVFELQLEVDAETYGQEVVPLIASRRLPYRVSGALEGGVYQAPYALEGVVQLAAPR